MSKLTDHLESNYQACFTLILENIMEDLTEMMQIGLVQGGQRSEVCDLCELLSVELYSYNLLLGKCASPRVKDYNNYKKTSAA